MPTTRKKMRRTNVKENSSVVNNISTTKRLSQHRVLEEVKGSPKYHSKRYMLSDDEDDNTVENTKLHDTPKKIKLEDGKGQNFSATGTSRRQIITTAEQSLETKPWVKVEKQECEEEEIEEKEAAVLSPYELMIKQNIAEKRKRLELLGILQVKEELKNSMPPVKKTRVYRGIVRSPSPSRPVVLRRSLRQQRQTPDGLHLPLPSDKEVARAEEYKNVAMPPPGPAPIVEYCRDSDKEAWKTFQPEVEEAVRGNFEKDGFWTGSIDSVVRRMKSMQIHEERVAKVVPGRTYAIQIHPTVDKTLVLVGAKGGALGVWDVGQEDDSNGAHYFNPHRDPIICLTVDPSQPSNIYTSSYDATLRTINLESGIVRKVYDHVSESVTNQWISWHAHADPNTILVAASHGKVLQIDVREDKKKPRVFRVHNDHNVKVVTQHPVNFSYFATCSRDGNVCLWDVRSMKANSPLAKQSSSRVVCGLEFSPITGNSLISTCLDDSLKFISCDLSQLKVTCKIMHNNFTGRWLSNFNARFVPGREDLVVVGSMMKPRRVELYGSDGTLHHEFMGEDLKSVCSVNAFHPSKAILAGANSSGKVHVFM